MERRKKLINVDLDGVLNTYCGKYEEDRISPVRDGAYEFLENLSKDFRIAIFTARNTELTKKWLEENDLSQFVEDVSNIKSPFASVLLDDRAINFDGDFSKAYDAIKVFKPHWK